MLTIKQQAPPNGLFNTFPQLVKPSRHQRRCDFLKRLIFVVALLVTVSHLCAPDAAAGTGTFRNGQFNFCISLRWNATEAQMQRMREVIQVASQVLYDATDGQHSFGTISLVNNSGASNQADIWIFFEGGRADATSGGYGFRGRHANLFWGSNFALADTMKGALIFVHEFAHLAYAVDDEYRKPGPGEPIAHCPGADRNSPTLNYCIMDDINLGAHKLTPNYSVNEFCVDSNHDKHFTPNDDQENDTAQSATNHGDSCWETMSKIERKWRLNAPANLPQDAPPTTTPPPVIFNTDCVSQTQRVVLLFDVSGSMVTEDRLLWARQGAANNFIPQYSDGDFLGVVSFSNDATLNFPLTQINANTRTQAQVAVNSLVPLGLTNLSAGLTLALSQLNDPNCPDCQKTIILLSDGDSNLGPPPESLIASLQAADVKVIATTVGKEISVGGEATLKTIATQTGGLYFRGERPGDFMHFFVGLVYGTGPYRAVSNAPQFIGSNQTKEIPVLVESNVASMSFAISLEDPTDSITLSLRKPSGEMITASNAPPGQFTSNAGLKTFKIPTPDAGTWTMVLTSGTVKSGNLQVFTFAQHDGTDFWASFDDDNVAKNESLKLHATPTHDGKNVTGAVVTGQVVHPNGSRAPITLFDDGLAAHGDNFASDGIYSALFNSYSEAGTYTFNLKYENTSGQTYTGEPMPDENGVVPSFTPVPVPPVTRITTVTAVVSSVTDVVWFDDVLPEGSTPRLDATAVNDGWTWVDANPGGFSGTKSHQSLNLKLVNGNKIHAHGFDGAPTKLHVGSNDVLFTYVFLDINNLPTEIMLEFKDANGSWEHRVYWGDDSIIRGSLRTPSRVYGGQLPKPGQWVRLEMEAAALGLSNADITGMNFLLYGGRAAFDYTGKATRPFELPVTSEGDTIWVDGAVPAGATAQVQDDVWQWIQCVGIATACHQSITPPPFNTNARFRQHYFTGGPPQLVNPGDILFTQVLIDPTYRPDEIVIQWHDGKDWHRAYWGNNYWQLGIEGTENWRYMGGLPANLIWTRLEVPASYVGLEGKYVTGMAFGFYRKTDNGQVIWGKSGKAATASTVSPVLSPMTAVYQFFHSQFGYYYSTKSIGLNSADRFDDVKFYAHPNQAPGTVPYCRYTNTNTTKREFFYSKCSNPPNINLWKPDGIAFYVYPNDSTPGVVPLNLFHDSVLTNHYFLSLADFVPGMVKDGISAYVHPVNPLVPARPYFVNQNQDSCTVQWLDSSNNEAGFKIQTQVYACYLYIDETGSTYERCFNDWWNVGTVGPNVTQFNVCTHTPDEAAGEQEATGGDSATGPHIGDMKSTTSLNRITGGYRVVAFNDVGDSEPSNLVNAPGTCQWCLNLVVGGTEDVGPVPASIAPSVDIASPLEGEVVSRELSVVANAFDRDGNGTLAKVELFDGAVKVGELAGPAPFNLIWNNAANGPHTLTLVATDASGVSSTSAPVHITVTGAPSVTLTNPTDGTVVTAPGSITLQATATDPENSVAKVEFYQGTVKLGEDNTAPYSFAWNNIQSGSYELSARVIDNAGLSAISNIVPLIANSPPTIQLDSPTNGQVVTAPGTALLVANVADTDSSITKVDFYQGTTLIGTSTTFPYTYNWTNIPYGTYNITAKVTDSYGAVTTSTLVTFIVNSPPSVSITTPTNQAMLPPFTNASITANASDPDGTITKVDFYQGSTFLGTANAAPYSVSWNNLAPASYQLTAVATDNRGAITTSPVIAVTTPVFFDDFNDNSLDASKWSVIAPTSPAIVSESGQQLRITLPASTATYNGVVSNATYDMRGSTVQVEQVQSVSHAGWTENFLKIEKDWNNYLMIQTGVGNSLFRQTVNGVNNQVIIPFDPVAHRYVRIRHDVSTNVLKFESSADALNWTTRLSLTAGFALTGVRFQLWAGAYGTGNANPGAAVYNDFQFISPIAAILSDDFDDNNLNTTNWTANDLFSGTIDTSLPINEIGQRLEIGPLLQNTSGSHYRGIRTVNAYDFSNAASHVELVQAPAANTTAYAMFTVGKDVDNYYRLYVSNGNLVGEYKIFGTKVTLFTIPYDAVNHRFLRIRHNAGSMIMETAPSNGVGPGTWTPLYASMWSGAITITAIRFEMKAGTSVAEANAPGTVIFDNFAFTRSNQYAAPTLSSVSPTSGNPAGGTALTIVGSQFQLGATVSIGGLSATNVVVQSTTNITATAPAHAAGPVSVTVTNPDGQNATLVNGYLYTTQTVLLDDNFNDNNLNTTVWTASDLFSGTTDTALPINETGGRLEIGPLLQNTGSSHYRGVRTVNTYDFTNGAAYVELAQPAASNTTAYAMFTVGKDVDNYYRLYVSNGSLVGEYKIGGTKVTLFTNSYDAVNHRFLRIRHQAGSMIMESAPASGAAPGNWTPLYTQMWSSAVPVNLVRFELKGGTSVAEANAPGKVIFDNMLVLR